LTSTSTGTDLGEGLGHRVQVGQVAADVDRRDPSRQLLGQDLGILVGDVEEDHLGALAHEAGDDAGADARAAAGDDDALASEAGIDG
jgi:hypothetical protein